MSTTLLTGVNDALKSLRLIQGDNAALSSLTDSARQTDIDLIVQLYNEVMDEIYNLTELPMPKQMGEADITLVTNDRDYSLPSDLTEVEWPLQDEANGQYIYEWQQGYQAMLNSQVTPASYTGLPRFAVVSPVDNTLFLDTYPTSEENGRVYKLKYRKDTIMDNPSDIFPFTDVVYRAVRRVVIQLYKSDRKKTTENKLLNLSLGRAAALLSQSSKSPSYSPFRRFIAPLGDPMEA